MPNWAYGEVKATGTRESIESFINRFSSNKPGKRIFARSYLKAERQEIISNAMEAFVGQSDNAKAECSFAVTFAWSAYRCLINGYPGESPEKYMTLSEACIEDNVSVVIRTCELDLCFEEHITASEEGVVVHAGRNLGRCKCRHCGAICNIHPFDGLDGYDCPACGKHGFDRYDEEWVTTEYLGGSPQDLVEITTSPDGYLIALSKIQKVVVPQGFFGFINVFCHYKI